MTAAELDAELAWHAEAAKKRLLANGEVPMMVIVRGARQMAFLPLKSEDRRFNQRLTRIAAIDGYRARGAADGILATEKRRSPIQSTPDANRGHRVRCR